MWESPARRHGRRQSLLRQYAKKRFGPVPYPRTLVCRVSATHGRINGWLLSIPKPHAWPISILINEDDAGGFERGADGGKVILSGCSALFFEINSDAAGYRGGGSEFVLV